jgi:beta-glucosidase
MLGSHPAVKCQIVDITELTMAIALVSSIFSRSTARVSVFLAIVLLSKVSRTHQKGDESVAAVESLLSEMSLEQKLKLVGGDGMSTSAIPEIKLLPIRMSDGPAGVRSGGRSNAYPVGIAVAATWDRDLAFRLGSSIGGDARARGVRILLAPGVNTYRTPMNGRNFEYMGEDPYLSSRMAVAYINGVQSQGVGATVKHYVGNDSEFDRHRSNAVVDERTMREIYLPPFEAAVKEAHVSAVMDAYNLLNGQHMTQNDFLNNGILKKEWGFDGVVMSDWNATYDGIGAANGGLDLEMPRAKYMTPATLASAIEDGTLSLATLDEHVRRILRLAVRYGLVRNENVEPSGALYNPVGKRVAYDVAAESIVLLKNDGNLLPLNPANIHRVALLGPNVYPPVFGGGGSSSVAPYAVADIYTSLSDALGAGVEVMYSPGIMNEEEIFHQTSFDEGGITQEVFSNPDFSGTGERSQVQHIDWWAPSSKIADSAQQVSKGYRWTGTYSAKETGKYLVLVGAHGNDSYTLRLDGKVVLEHARTEATSPMYTIVQLDAGRKVAVELDFVQRDRELKAGLGIVSARSIVLPEARNIAAKADVSIVMLGFNPIYESEGFDRTWKLPLGQDQLISEVMSVNLKTIVVLNAGGGVDISNWVDRVPAILHAWYGGEEGNHALADVLDGKVNPSGKLPISFERHIEDNAAFRTYYPKAGTNDIVYSEGIFVGYRHFDRSGNRPLFPFGFGLSYTRFAFSDLKVREEKKGTIGISFRVRNAGLRGGDEIAEIYVGEKDAPVPRPLKELKGFERLHLEPGESRRVNVKLDARAFSYWDAKSHGWKRDAANFQIYVGESSASVPLVGSISLN